MIASFSCTPKAPEPPLPTQTFTFEGCIEGDDFFKHHVNEKVVAPICIGCHVSGGQAGDTSLVFVTDVYPDHLEQNYEILKHMAGLERDGTSIVLLKPLGLEDHEGGVVLVEGSETYAILKEFVKRADEADVICEDEEPVVEEALPVVLDSPLETLRSATLNLVGRLPYAHEVTQVRVGGEEALSKALDQIMEEEAFADRVMEMFGDMLLTDKYLVGNSGGVGLVDYERFYDLYWYNEILDNTQKSLSRTQTNRAFAREPLEIIRHVITNKRPFTEILTADYTMMNRYSARSRGLHYDDLDPYDSRNEEFYPVQLEGVPHAGILTTPAYLNRFPTTPTNRNRHRIKVFLDFFLATDILSFAERPIDPSQTTTHNPTMNDPQCTLCHEVIDPLGGLFQNWDDDGHYYPREDGWFSDMRVPGYAGESLPVEDRPKAVQWLAQKTVTDARFGLSIMRHVFYFLTGIEVVDPKHFEDPAEKKAAENLKEYLLQEATLFSDSDFDLRASIRRIILSNYYRVQSHGGGDSSHADYLRSPRFLAPAELSRKIFAVMGMPWVQRGNQQDHLTERYALFYGGVDFDSVIERLKEPNGVMASVSLRMANDVACVSTARDFGITPGSRRLFPFVEPTYEPETADGFAIPAVEEKIKQNIQHLHNRMLGESLALDDPEINHTYTLWAETWQEGKAAMEEGELNNYLPSACTASWVSWTNASLPNELRVRYDYNYTIRAWTAVIAYLLSDYRFLYQ
jgi:hypothetical protein